MSNFDSDHLSKVTRNSNDSPCFLPKIARYYCFSYTGTWELVNLFGGKKNFSYENIGRTDRTEGDRTNILVKKNVLNEINKEETFTQGFKCCRKIKGKVSQNLDVWCERYS